ncbi:MAG: hypothetical protein WBW33_34525 [Bryobacteraceae bacterium]
MADNPQLAGAPRWPSIEQQLRESHVIPGSALEKLVLDNQNFDMLLPQEAHDKIRVPLWLRVQFRKNHPELTFKPSDPSGGYPLALRDLYNWMVANQDLVAKTDAGGGSGN